MSVTYFSQHSSNPLEARTSDARNLHYNRVYAEANAQLDEVSPSSDPLARYPQDELREYHEHLAEVIPGHPQTMSQARKKETRMVELDEDGDGEEEMSDDELMIIPKEEEDVSVDDGEQDKEGNTPQQQQFAEYDEDMDAEGEWDEDVEVEEPKEKDYFALDESEEMGSIDKKTEDEIAEIEKEIEEFEVALPTLASGYKLLDRLGTGTFSSVYKALDLRYHEYDNSPWLGHHPEESSAHFQSVPQPEGSRVFVAIKRIYVTSGPERIRNELFIMETCRGARHVSQLITAFRHHDQVAIVMPYHRNEDFRDYYETLPMEGIKSYFRCLLRALRDIHARGIIHRDVKPANFLFDPSTGQGTLCDFGLAQIMDDKPPVLGACLHTQPTEQYPHGHIRKKHQYDENLVKEGQMDARKKSKMHAHSVGILDKDTRMPMKANRAGTRGFRAPEVLLKCGQQSGAVDVWSAGIILLFFLTRKFPIFQSNDDIEALMELAVIFGRKKMESVATLHARKFATNVPDIPQDQVKWTTMIEKLNPDLLTPPTPKEHFYPYTLPSYRAKLRQEEERRQQRQQDTHRTPTRSSRHEQYQEDDVESDAAPPTSRLTSSSPLLFPRSSPANHVDEDIPSSPGSDSLQASWEQGIRDAMDLVTKLLEPESVKRITPAAALAHPFLREEDKLDDDYYVPHVFGRGVCGKYHFYDDVTEQPGVIIRERRRKCVCNCGLEECQEQDENAGEWVKVRKLVSAGEGIAIGMEPCEFHQDYQLYDDDEDD
ncbi:CMGC/MAPK protein kinase [Coprinopsis cinerea AmutBmut pab1-1]|nr:CMGC/MAPK protein kinase [Coprinopsis cinerea AmutBmut pab1-1]